MRSFDERAYPYRLASSYSIKKKITNNFKYPDFLGYLGIALHYSQSAENENRILTEKWIPQFIDIINADSKKQIVQLENTLSDNKIFTWKEIKF